MSLTLIKRRIQERLDATGLDMKSASLEAGLGETFVRDILKRDREPSASKLQDLSRILGCTVAYLVGETDILDEDTARSAGDLVTVNEHDVRLSAGPGALFDEESAVGVWRFSRAYLVNELRLSPASLAVVQVEGDSMEPTLRSGDRVLIDHADRNPAKPGIYAIWDSDATVVKRLELVPYSDPTELVLISDNKNHNQYRVLAELVNVIGRVVWYARRV
ncbi:XRE family transcriptional regulator [uncultured Brevundimonas sp.]|uniref:LexA family transcriptional regulator n=1 Tax=uncultured Brevundimonas sp. TaxID=213418 RepID=UPI00261140C5|nr:XRE family transcriptional regulator [uncultured Brevundimonas sp.]